MTRGHTLPRGDIARMNRAVVAFESGELQARASGNTRPREPRLTPFMLLEEFIGTETPDGHRFGREWSAQALLLEPTRLLCQLLRVKNLHDLSQSLEDEFHFRRGEWISPPVHTDASAAELQAALETHPELQGRVAVFGYQSVIAEASSEREAVLYTARQWHLLYDASIEQPATIDESELTNLQFGRDWMIPIPRPETVWTGLPIDNQADPLAPGAFGYCYPLGHKGWTWLYGECYTRPRGA